MEKDKIIKVCEQIAFDVEDDARRFDGKPFNGKTLGEYLGYHSAAISTLANIVKQLIENTFEEGNKTKEGS